MVKGNPANPPTSGTRPPKYPFPAHVFLLFHPLLDSLTSPSGSGALAGSRRGPRSGHQEGDPTTALGAGRGLKYLFLVMGGPDKHLER